jgi:hypothetical protein
LLSAQLADDKLTFDSENGREATPGSVAVGNRRSEDVGSIVQLALGSFLERRCQFWPALERSIG